MLTTETLLNFAAGTGIFIRPTVISVVLMGLWRGTETAGFNHRRRLLVFASIAAPLIAWFLLAEFLGQSGVYAARTRSPSLLPVAIGIPVLVGIIVSTRSRMIGLLLNTVPSSWLVAVQVYRVFGAVFLLQWLRGLAPGEFAIPAGVGDIITGLAAAWVAPRVGRATASRSIGYVWNLFGIADLIVALSMGVMTSPGPLQLFAFFNPSRLAYPLILIPTFSVPLSLILHAASLVQLARRRSQTAEASPTRPSLRNV